MFSKTMCTINRFKKLMSSILVDFLKKTDYDNKITEIEGKIPSITGLATTAALNAVENDIPKVSDRIKKANYVVNNSRY